MDSIEELEEILYECHIKHEKILDWYKKHENDKVFETEVGKNLRNHLGGIIKQQALAWLSICIIELQESLKNYREDVISEFSE